MVKPMGDVAEQLQQIALEAKAGTPHADHDGWEWKYPDRVLRCICGAMLVNPTPPRQEG